MQTQVWTDDREERLRKFWAEGLTCSAIANQLGGVTRNAVIGKVRRLGLEFRANGSGALKIHRQVSEARRRSKSKPASAPKKPAGPFAALSTSPLPPAPQTDIARVSSFDLEPHHCRWPCAEAGHYTKPIYCGEKRVPGVSYCDHHARRAFAATTVSEPRTSVVRTRITNVVKTLVPA